jgi:hypothetical protein
MILLLIRSEVRQSREENTAALHAQEPRYT